MSAIDEYAMERLARKPWLAAGAGDMWLLSGEYPGGKGTFTRCTAVVVPSWVTGVNDRPLFVTLPPLNDPIDPEWVTSGVRLTVTRDDTGTEWNIYREDRP